MKTKEQIMLEFAVSDMLLGLVYEENKDKLTNNMTTSDLQGYCTVKAMEIVTLFKNEINLCKSEGDFEECLKKRGLL